MSLLSDARVLAPDSSTAGQVERDLARFAVAVAEALPKLRSRCARVRCAQRDGDADASIDCTCGADAHNAILDGLRAMLEGK